MINTDNKTAITLLIYSTVRFWICIDRFGFGSVLD